MDHSMSGFPVLYYLLEFTQTHVHWVGDAIYLSHPLSPSSPPALNLSQPQDLFQWVSSSHQVVKVLALQLQHQPFNEYPGLISFRIDWFDLLAGQGTLKSLLQHHTSKASTLPCSVFFMVQLSHLWACLVGQLVKNPSAMQETQFDSWVRKISGEGIGYALQYSWASLVAKLVKNQPAITETWVQSLGWDDPLEKGTATHSRILAWRIPWTI